MVFSHNSDMNGFIQRGIAHLKYYTNDRIMAEVTLDKPYRGIYDYEVAATILSGQIIKQTLSYIPKDNNRFELYISSHDHSYEQGIDIAVAWIAIGK